MASFIVKVDAFARNSRVANFVITIFGLYDDLFVLIKISTAIHASCRSQERQGNGASDLPDVSTKVQQKCGGRLLYVASSWKESLSLVFQLHQKLYLAENWGQFPPELEVTDQLEE